MDDKQKKSAPIFELPEALRTPELVAAWTDFNQHRREMKKKITPLSAQRNFADFAKWGVERSIVAINNSIACGWSGIFEPKQTKKSAGQVNGASRQVPRSPETQAKLVRETAIVKFFNDIDPTVQDVLLAEFKRLSPENASVSYVNRKFREWAYDTKYKEGV